MITIDFKYIFSEDIYNQFLTLAKSTACEYRLVKRAKIIIEYYHTVSVKQTATRVGVDPQTAITWIKRVWEAPRVESLMDRTRAGKKKSSRRLTRSR